MACSTWNAVRVPRKAYCTWCDGSEMAGGNMACVDTRPFLRRPTSVCMLKGRVVIDWLLAVQTSYTVVVADREITKFDG